jgi:hypothetical protein
VTGVHVVVGPDRFHPLVVQRTSFVDPVEIMQRPILPVPGLWHGVRWSGLAPGRRRGQHELMTQEQS